jgi:hypothetical protein
MYVLESIVRAGSRVLAGAYLVMAVMPAVAQTSIAPDAARLLVGVRHAGGADAWRRVPAMGVEGRVTASGLEADYRAFEDPRLGRFDRRSRFPIFEQREVWDGHTRWRQDNSGGVHRLDGDFAMKRNATDAWLTRRGWLLADGAGAYLGPVSQQTVDGRSYQVVTAIPSDGQAATLFFDAATLDLARIERVMPTSIEETRYGDYRDVDGVRLPFLIETDDHDEDVETLRVARYDLHAPPQANAFRAPSAPHDWSMARGPVTVPLDLRNGVLTIEAKVNGQGPYRFIFDTGGHSIVSPALAKTLGLETVGAGQSGGAGESLLTEQYTRVAKLDIAGLSLTNQHFYVLPMGYATFERGHGAPLGGLLGLELLERFAVRFDYAAKTVTFTPFASHRFDPTATITPVRFDDDIPLVPGRLDGHDGIFALDTGNAGSMLVQRHWAERIGVAERMKQGLETASFGAGGMSRNWVSRVERFDVGGTTLEHLVGRYAEDRRGSFTSRTEAGNIGTQILANFVLDLDYRRGLMSWRYVRGYVAPPFNRGGLRALKNRPEDFDVVVVATGSPADEAGLRVKDHIAAVDGVASASLSGADLNDAFAQPSGTRVRLDVVRDNQPIAVVVTLKELLP